MKLFLNAEGLKNFIYLLVEQKSGRVYEDKSFAWILCPFHADTNPSLRINLKTGHFHCMACGETGSIVKLWQKLQDYEDSERARQDLVSLRVFKADKPKEEAVYYYYHHQTGELLFRKRKLRHADGSKTFVIEHYDYDNEVWRSGKPKDCPPALYNYDAVVLARQSGKPVFVVEGERDVETLKNLGYLATTSGRANDWKTELTGEFAGLEVVLIPDNDPAGKQWLLRVGSDIIV